jgi:brefeldin A-resistance guanine nucleotide exchange factor 1
VAFSSQTEWNVVFAVLRSTVSHPEAANKVFDAVFKLVTDSSENLVSVDNYTGIITVLDEFASIAGTAIEAQRQQRRREPPPTSTTCVQAACFHDSV